MKEVVADVIGTSSGYAIGQGLNVYARHGIEKSRKALFGTHARATVYKAEARSKRILQQAAAGIALLGASAGFAAGEALLAKDAPQKSPAIKLQVIADHKYWTIRDGSLARINAFGTKVAQMHGINTVGIVAHNGFHDGINLSRLNYDRPLGPPSMDSALAAALTAAFNESDSSTNTKKKPSSAILAINDADSLGSAEAVKSSSTLDGHVPVYIVDEGQPSLGTQASESRLAESTGGHYFNSSATAGTVVSYIKHDLHPSPGQEIPQNKLPMDILAGALTALTLLRTYQKRTESAVA